MKTFFCIAVSTFVFVSAVTAQPIRLGLQAGMTSSFMKSQYQNINEETDGTQKFGFSAGIVADVRLTRNLCLSPSLNFTQKGAVYRYTNYVSRGERTLNYAELLLNVLYCVPAGNGQFSIGLGPGVSCGLSGKYKDKLSITNTIDKGSIEFGNSEKDDYKPIDFGANITTGYEFSAGFSVALNYYLGLSNLAVNDFGDNTAKNRYIGLRLGYLLSRSSKK